MMKRGKGKRKRRSRKRERITEKGREREGEIKAAGMKRERAQRYTHKKRESHEQSA